MSNYDLSKQVNEILMKYGDQAIREIEDCTRSTANVCARKATENTIAKGLVATGKYAKGWRFKLHEDRFSCGFTVYNAARPTITHLLEYGYHPRGGDTKIEGVEHIQPTQDYAVEWFLKAIKGRLERL